jgi:bile acid:Na+ symporter, BASS family
MSIDQLINLLVTVTLIEMMVATGLGVTLAGITGVIRNRRLLLRAALANYVCVPATAIGLLLAFRSPPMIAAGFLIAAVCPGAPYGPPFTAFAKGNVAASVGLMVVLAGSSALLAPLLLSFLLPWMGGDNTLSVDAGKMVVIRLLRAAVSGMETSPLNDKVAQNLFLPCLQLLGEFCGAFDIGHDQDAS